MQCGVAPSAGVRRHSKRTAVQHHTSSHRAAGAQFARPPASQEGLHDEACCGLEPAGLSQNRYGKNRGWEVAPSSLVSPFKFGLVSPIPYILKKKLLGRTEARNWPLPSSLVSPFKQILCKANLAFLEVHFRESLRYLRLTSTQSISPPSTDPLSCEAHNNHYNNFCELFWSSCVEIAVCKPQ